MIGLDGVVDDAEVWAGAAELEGIAKGFGEGFRAQRRHAFFDPERNVYRMIFRKLIPSDVVDDAVFGLPGAACTFLAAAEFSWYFQI